MIAFLECSANRAGASATLGACSPISSRCHRNRTAKGKDQWKRGRGGAAAGVELDRASASASYRSSLIAASSLGRNRRRDMEKITLIASQCWAFSRGLHAVCGYHYGRHNSKPIPNSSPLLASIVRPSTPWTSASTHRTPARGLQPLSSTCHPSAPGPPP